MVPNPNDPATGKVSAGINYATDFENKKGSPIGLGYRVPFVVASPWSRGGFVNSQVFDHTSSLLFMEKWLSKKTGKQIKSDNISDWRRAICGDLTSVFRLYNGEEIKRPAPLERHDVVASIGNAKNKPAQSGPTALNETEISKINKFEAFSSQASAHAPKQENGTKPACALPYQLNVDANVVNDQIEIILQAAKTPFGNPTENTGAPFNMSTNARFKGVKGKIWAYAVMAGDQLKEVIKINDFDGQVYDLSISGPNGFYRHFVGNENNSHIHIIAYPEEIGLVPKKLSGHLILSLENKGEKPTEIQIIDNKYQSSEQKIHLKAKTTLKVSLDLSKNANWYDFSIMQKGNEVFKHRYAGKIETGAITTTDPFMGNVL